MKRRTAVFVSGLVLAACGSSQVGQTTENERRLPPAASMESAHRAPSTTGVEAAAPVTAAPTTREQAHDLLVTAVGCWLGGVWSDAEGAKEDERINAAKQRCHALVQHLYGADDQARYEKLRALDESAISELNAKITVTAQSDVVDKGRAQQLVQLLQAIAAAEREAMAARRAANTIKNDIAVVQPTTKRNADELAAVKPLSEGRAFETLLRLDAGDLSHEAQAIAVLYAVDRMETARALPTHLKLYAVGHAFSALFGVAAPDVGTDASKPIKGGIWLSYLTAVAKAAGHPVPDKARSHRDQELMAWGGVFMGLADKLGAEAELISDATELKRVTKAVARRLGIEYRASEAAILNAAQEQ